MNGTIEHMQSQAPQPLSAVREEIEAACRAVNRDPGEVTLVAVTKMADEGMIEPVLAAGHRVFGENRVQEAKAKWPALREAFPDVELHLLGPLQTNKAKDAVALFDVVESVDRERVAEAIAAAADKAGRMPRCLVQVNIGREPLKLCVIYTPPVMPAGTVHHTRADALEAVPA